MIKIVADNKIPFLKDVLEPYAQVVYLPGKDTGQDEVKDADALITRTRTKCNSELLKSSKVKYIATATIGFDHIDTQFCKENNILWSNAPGCNSGSVQQYIASVFGLLRRQKKIDFNNITLGIVGVGNVGKKVKQVAEAIGMTVLLNDPPREQAGDEEDFVDLKTIQENADILTFHVPLQRGGEYKTFHMGDYAFFQSCKKKPVIINTCRGEVLDNNDLWRAFGDKFVSDIILDVWENEPAIHKDLLNNAFIATPHIAGYSVDGKANGTSASVQAISRFFNLPLTDWIPDSLPVPKENAIHVDAAGKDIQDIISDIFLHTYPIFEDDQRLRNELSSFEEQRGSYPVRREFGAYTVFLDNGSEEIKDILNKIGFCNVQIVK